MINKAAFIIREVGLAILTITIFTTISYLITYSFLFGYYFGGELNFSSSNFEIFRSFVPFDVNTLTYTYIMISISVSLIVYLLNLIKKSTLSLGLFGVFVFLIFHVFITIFFTQELNLKNVMYFSAIWILPLFIGLMIWFVMRGANKPFKTFSGTLFAFSLIVMIILLFHFDSANDLIMLIFSFSIFGFGVLFSLIPYKKYWNFIFVFPYTFVSVSCLVWITRIENYFKLPVFAKYTIFLLIPLLLSVSFSFIFKDKFLEKSTPSLPSENKNTLGSTISNFFNVYINERTHHIGRAFIIITLLVAYVLIPRVSTEAGKIIRSFTPASESQFDDINYKDAYGKPKSTKGVIVTEQDNVLYISNTSWKLEQVKTSAYEVIPEKE